MRQTDQKLYRSGDMVRIGCDECRGCSDCCRGMGSSIVLNPYDVFALCKGLGTDFEALLASGLELQVQDGVVLPNLKMAGATNACAFLDEAGRCTIHAFRPGLCRLFPLGRQYGDGELRYFILEGACPHSTTKVKIDKWLGIGHLKRHEQFLVDWHDLVKRKAREMQALMRDMASDADRTMLQNNMAFLQIVYRMPYDPEQDFYEQFEERRKNMTKIEQYTCQNDKNVVAYDRR